MIIPLLIGVAAGYTMRPRVSVDPKRGLYAHKPAFGARSLTEIPIRDLRALDHKLDRWIKMHEQRPAPAHLKEYTARWVALQRGKLGAVKAELRRRGY